MGENVDAAAIALAEAVDVALGGDGGPFEFLRWKRRTGREGGKGGSCCCCLGIKEEGGRKTLVVIWTARRDTLSQHVHDETIRENDAV